jgi:hypothetical protein
MTATDAEVAALAERIRVLSAGLGLDEPFEVPDDVRRHVAAGQDVAAIRELRRQVSGRLSLLAAKRMIDALGTAPERGV